MIYWSTGAQENSGKVRSAVDAGVVIRILGMAAVAVLLFIVIKRGGG